MIGNSKRSVSIGALIALSLALLADSGFAQGPAPTVTPTQQEVIAAIKRRAQQILEARRAARRLKWAFREASQVVAYESNPSNGTSHVGDSYLEQNVYLMLSKKFTPTLDWNGTYYGSVTEYLEYTDGTYTSHTFTPLKLRWQPGAVWRIEGWTDLDYLWYPAAGASSYRQVKTAASIRQNLQRNWYHQLQYEWFARDYISKKARDGAGSDILSSRQDARHKIRYKMGATLKKTLYSAEEAWDFNDSNDARQDFYDSEANKLTLSVNHPFNDKLSANLSWAFERKNYNHRQVTGNVTASSRYDDTYTYTLSGNYKLSDDWSLKPKFTYKYLDSNEPTGEYTDTTGSLTTSVKF